MRLRLVAAALAAILFGLPLDGRAQTVRCVGCDIAQQNAEIQAAANRMIVQQQLQADLQNRLRIQQTTLHNQQLLNAVQLRSSLDANDWAIREILLREQLNILHLQARQLHAKIKAKKPH